MLFSHGHMEDIKDFLVGIDTETLVKHESRWQQLKVRVCLPTHCFWYTLFVYHLIKHMRTALHDHMLARIASTLSRFGGTVCDRQNQDPLLQCRWRCWRRKSHWDRITLRPRRVLLVLRWRCVRFSLGFHLWCRRSFFSGFVQSGFSSAWQGLWGSNAHHWCHLQFEQNQMTGPLSEPTQRHWDTNWKQIRL